jgi:hypothetical protein
LRRSQHTCELPFHISFAFIVKDKVQLAKSVANFIDKMFEAAKVSHLRSKKSFKFHEDFAMYFCLRRQPSTSTKKTWIGSPAGNSYFGGHPVLGHC